jgi:hypothetical protein
MYNEQYAKGIVHLVVFVILTSLASDVNGVFGLLVAGWIFYMAIEAHHTARARREGTPLPNPFGLNDIGERLGFGKAWPSSTGPTPPAPGFYPTGEPQPYANPYVPPASHWGAPQETYGPQATYGPQGTYVPPPGYVPPQGFVPPAPEPIGAPVVDPSMPMYKRIPAGALWLIGLGIFFLLSNVGLHIISGRLLVPFLLIGIGVYTFVNKMTVTGHGLENDGTDFYRWRLANALHGTTWLVLVGVVMLLHELGIMRWGASWPIFLIAAGILLMLRHSLMSNYPPVPPYPPYPPTPPTPPATPPASTEIVPSPRNNDSGTQEGR